MKSFISSILVMAILITSEGIYASQTGLKVRSKGAVLIEQESKRVLYEKNAYESLPMASTTKIMTCIVALEKGRLSDTVTVSDRAARAPEVKLHLRRGEKQKLSDLLYSLMLESHNDSAVAIAEHIGGSVESFCDMMTAKAKEIGANHTSFKTPNGLDAPMHFTTAYDLALIGAYALKNSDFVKIVTTTNINIPTEKLQGARPHGLQNKNRFLYTYAGATGMKTGFTNKAGHCFVGSAGKNDMQLIGVALAAGWGKLGKSQKFKDVIAMMDYGFRYYKKYTLVKPTKSFSEVPVKKGIKETLLLECEEKIVLPLSAEEEKNIVLKKVVPTVIEAPVQKGTPIGTVEIICNGRKLDSVSLYAQEDINKATLFDYIKKWLKIKE